MLRFETVLQRLDSTVHKNWWNSIIPLCCYVLLYSVNIMLTLFCEVNDGCLILAWRIPLQRKTVIERSIQPDSWIARMTCTLNQFRSYALARLDVLYDINFACDRCSFHCTVNPNSSNHWRSCLAEKYMNLFTVIIPEPRHIASYDDTNTMATLCLLVGATVETLFQLWAPWVVHP